MLININENKQKNECHCIREIGKLECFHSNCLNTIVNRFLKDSVIEQCSQGGWKNSKEFSINSYSSISLKNWLQHQYRHRERSYPFYIHSPQMYLIPKTGKVETQLQKIELGNTSPSLYESQQYRNAKKPGLSFN